MKKSILLLSTAFFMLVAFAQAAQYGNSSWTGPWIISGNGLQNYLIFDGAGTITEAGKVGATGGQGTYAITGLGVITGTIVFGGSTVPFTGSMINDSTSTISVGLSFTLNQVKNVAAAAGTWGTQLVQTIGGSSSKNVTIEVDASGHVANTTGLAGTVTGKVFYSNGKVAGLLNTGEATPWTQIQLNGSTFTGTAMSGSMDLTGSTANTFSLTLQSGLSTSEVSASKVQLHPNPVSNQFVIDGLSSGTLKIYDILGNTVATIVVNSAKTVLNADALGLNKGVYFYSVCNNQNTQGKFIVE